MAKRMFDKPVSIITDGGPVREIATPFEAYTFLVGRKKKRFDVADTMLRQKCSAASLGVVKVKTAREAFVRYAEKHNILAPETFAATAPAAETEAAAQA